ncbi:uncharacterized protein LOC116090570 [Mastomys coucha]|uniref:uncharacterized protein LOC116090570 n=1 Tax=Mastomys coucha TaxID=35658 RepID=UPI0012621BF6|nr:uncharacterized protein LOC116090570 [Mastomys coucha]
MTKSNFQKTAFILTYGSRVDNAGGGEHWQGAGTLRQEQKTEENRKQKENWLCNAATDSQSPPPVTYFLPHKAHPSDVLPPARPSLLSLPQTPPPTGDQVQELKYLSLCGYSSLKAPPSTSPGLGITGLFSQVTLWFKSCEHVKAPAAFDLTSSGMLSQAYTHWLSEDGLVIRFKRTWSFMDSKAHHFLRWTSKLPESAWLCLPRPILQGRTAMPYILYRCWRFELRSLCLSKPPRVLSQHSSLLLQDEISYWPGTL